MTSPRIPWPGRIVTAGLVLLLLWSLRDIGLLDAGRLSRGAHNISVFVRDLFPPNPDVLPTVVRAMGETIQIAFVGTALGFALALPLSLVATPLLFGRWVAGAMRLLLAFVRTVPSLLWAIVFVVAVGLGPAAGALGIALYSLGYMGKLFYETFEGVDPEVLEAARGVGADRLQLARYALLPEAANGVIAQLLFMFEYNVRASSILGFVGAGGIGFYLLGYIQLLQYDNLTTALLVTFVAVVAIDRLSQLVRRRFLATPSTGAPLG
jgi:phosphonate transport system permease protein